MAVVNHYQMVSVMPSVGASCTPSRQIVVRTQHASRRSSTNLAIGLDLLHIMSFDQWKSLAAVERYLSFLILPDRAAYIFHGWLRPPPAP